MYPVLPVSYDCPLLIAPSVFSNVYLTCVLCTLYYQFLMIVHCWLPLRYSLTFIWLVCCVPCITSFLRLSIVDCPFGILWRLFDLCVVYPVLPVSYDCLFLIAPSVFSNVYLTCVLCTLYYQFPTIVHFWLPLRYSLTFIWLVCCVPCITSFLWLSILIAPSVFSNVYLTCVLCTLYYQFLTIVHFWLSLRYSLTFIWLVCCVPCITSFLWLSIVDCPFGTL